MRCRLLCALLFVAWTAEVPGDPTLYSGLWRSPFQVFGPLFLSLPVLHMYTWQLLLLALAPLCLLGARAFPRRARPLHAAMLASVGAVAVTFLWGLVRGGSAWMAYYQLWRWLAGLLVGALTIAVVRGRRDLRVVGLTVVAAALVRGVLAIWFYFGHVRGSRLDPPPNYLTTHEDSLLFVAGIMVLASWAMARRTVLAGLSVCLVSGVLLWAMVLNNRRVAWAELGLALGLAYLLLPPQGLRRRVHRWLWLAAPAALAYALVGWGRPEAVFAPLQALQTTGSDSDGSSLARLEENKNLVHTLASAGNPLLGTGWGHPYLERSSGYSRYIRDWELYSVLPHNSLLGLVVFSGLVGLFGIWLVVPVAAFLGARGYREAVSPVDRAAAMAAVSLLGAFAAQCYGDVGLQMLTCDLVFGVAVGAAGSVLVRAGRARARPPVVLLAA